MKDKKIWDTISGYYKFQIIVAGIVLFSVLIALIINSFIN